MDQTLKLKHTLDALFGSGVSKYLPKNIEIVFSRKTGRIKTVSEKGKLLCTLRIDGGLAISPYFAQILLKSKKFKENCLEVNQEAAPFVQDGKSVFCKHVVWCGKNIRIASDTPVLYKNKVIAVGKAVLSSEMISDFNRGMAVRVRDSLKSHRGESTS
ncbi:MULTISPECIES: PUA domain-containing protein [Nitrosarchaeum]|uniref:PUA domain containing protein n=1 Tax=Nitrosarchaeum koreense MY1 TaxID=1001994 RepID=F9CYS7_9ARCH|nr:MULTISPECIES: PUA domain-containing protein [Nitrosarchaeum]EGP94471.1 PUA domain containing protein [Nitrosarchaeum koreense MY1]QLH11611.1 queuine tRNA-ribosyltransferase [Nitrosarchaeum sp. AC2]